jgi:hypothetical protein
LHIPSFWQLAGGSVAHSLSGSVPFATPRHRPFAWPVFAIAHATHRPVQDDSQQTLSTHAPDEHWLLPLQGRPLACVGTHAPPAQ